MDGAAADGTSGGALGREPAAAAGTPSEERRRAALARAAELRRDLARYEATARPAKRARQRVLAWSLVLVALLAVARPSGARGLGPEARLLRGAASVGGHRLEAPGAAARVTSGDVVAVAPDGRVEIGLGDARLALHGGGRLLVERGGPPALRLLSGEANVLGPLVLQTPAGTLRVPAGIEVEVRRAIRRSGGGSGSGEPWGARGTAPEGAEGASTLDLVADGPGAELVDARGAHPVRQRGPG